MSSVIRSPIKLVTNTQLPQLFCVAIATVGLIELSIPGVSSLSAESKFAPA